MSVFRSKKKWVAVTVGVVLIGTFAAVALATAPSTTFVATPLVTASLSDSVQINSDRVKFQTKDPTDVRVQKIVIGAGGSSGWHHHPGMVIVAVASGSVTVWESDCSRTTYGAGSVFTESGDEAGQVTSADGATTYATLVAPHAAPPVFRIDDPAPACAS